MAPLSRARPLCQLRGSAALLWDPLLSCSLQDSAHLNPTCHSLFYSVLGSPGGFGNTAGSCPTRLPLFQTTTVCISPGSPRSLSSILPGPYVCCELYKLYSVSETWGGDTLAWAQGLPTWDWQREEMGAGLSRLITFFSR